MSQQEARQRVIGHAQHPILKNAFVSQDDLQTYCREQLFTAQSKAEIWAAVALVDRLKVLTHTNSTPVL